MKKILVILYKKPDMKKVLANPRTKNPNITYKVPYYYRHAFPVPDAEVEDIRMGRWKGLDELEKKLREEGYKGRYQLMMRRTPGLTNTTPKPYRKGTGPVYLWEGEIPGL